MTTISEPVVVLYKSKTCGHCKSLEAKWGKETDTDNSTVMGAMKKVYPKIRTFVLSTTDGRGAFDENIAPSDLSRWGKWYPMILLVPGRIWDNAMAALGPKNSATIIDGVQVFNGIREANGDLKYVQKYNPRQPEDFGRWIAESLNNEEFKKYQNTTGPVVQHTATTTTGLTIPVLPGVTTTGSAHIKPLIKNIIGPSQASQTPNHTYIAAGPFVDVCAMRVITRPK